MTFSLVALRSRLHSDLTLLVNDSETAQHTDLIGLLRDAVAEIDELAGEDA